MTRKALLALSLAGLLMMGGCADAAPVATQPVATSPAENWADELVCVEYSRFSGAFPEDGTGRQVTNVAAMLVRNDSGRFLDYALIQCDIGGGTGTFKVTGLPVGASAWVLEQSGMTVSVDDTFQVSACQDYAYRDDVVADTDRLTVTAEDNTVTVTNVSADTLFNVCIYYKAVHTDGNYFGGITYMLAFDTLEPGQSMQKQSSHFGPDTQIVRYSFQTA